MSLCSLSYLGGVLDHASAILCGSDAVACPVMGRINNESVKIQQYDGIKFGKDVANKIKFSKTETAVTQSEGTAFSLKEEMES